MLPSMQTGLSGAPSGSPKFFRNLRLICSPAARRPRPSERARPRLGAERSLSALLALLLAVGPALAERAEDVPNPRVLDGTWVTDLPAALRPDTTRRLNLLAETLERETTAEMAVVVIHDLEGRSIEDFANDLFNRWGIGKRGANNGVLFLWAVGDRRVRIEVGTGLEGVISDSRAGSVLDRLVIPRFKEKRFDDGVLDGFGELAALVRGGTRELPAEAARVYSPVEDAPRSSSGSPKVWVWLVGLAGLLASVIGGTLGLKRWRRYRRRFCPSCQTEMVRLAEDADDAHLEAAGRLEERLGSVDYDVWECRGCRHRFTLRYPRWFTSYGRCPQCSHRTCSKTEATIEAATTTSSGRARVTEDCEFCTYHRQYIRTIPRISSSSSSSGGGSSFGGGSSSGGGASRGY